MPYGRGGAGNIAASTPGPSNPITAYNANASSDLELQQSAADSSTNPAITSGASVIDPGHDFDTKENSAYAHMGRGGAGNYYSPKELLSNGKFEGAGNSHVVGDGTPIAEKTNEVKGPAYRGRGGAGNYAGPPEERSEKDVVDEKERLKKDIERGVEEGLARPEKARLPGGEPF